MSSSSIDGNNIDEKLILKVYSKRNKVAVAEANEVSDADQKRELKPLPFAAPVE